MFAKLVFLILLTSSISKLTHGQDDEKFFRKDYHYIKDTNSFYKVHTLHKSWENAKAKCEQEGANLFYPEDDDEALAVIEHWNTTQPQFHWVYIGVAAWNVKEVFETIDGRPISDVYDNWGYGEPNNADFKEDCVILRRDGTLNDADCSNLSPFICKKTLATIQWNTQCNIPDQNYAYSKELDRCYKFHLTPRNWTDAHATCNAELSYLAVINSEEERAYLAKITENAPKNAIVGDYLYGGVHLGFQNKNGWVTVKGVPLSESGYTRWANGQPDGGEAEACGSMFFSGELNDIGCFQKMFFICEHEVQLRSEELVYKFGEDVEQVFGSPPNDKQKKP